MRAQDRARSSDPTPPNEGLSRDPIVLHRIDAYHSSGAAKSSLAMNSDRTRIFLAKGFLTAGQKFVLGILGRSRTVKEYDIFMFDSFVYKLSSIILCSIKPDDLRDIELPKNVYIA